MFIDSGLVNFITYQIYLQPGFYSYAHTVNKWQISSCLRGFYRESDIRKCWLSRSIWETIAEPEWIWNWHLNCKSESRYIRFLSNSNIFMYKNEFETAFFPVPFSFDCFQHVRKSGFQIQSCWHHKRYVMHKELPKKRCK